jgi:hypothetical protein
VRSPVGWDPWVPGGRRRPARCGWDRPLSGICGPLEVEDVDV